MITLSIFIVALYSVCWLLSNYHLPLQWPLWDSPPPVSVLKPVRGLDPDAEANFRSAFEQQYPAPWEIIFALESPDDPAVPLIRRLMPEYDVPARIVISRPGQGITGKMANVLEAYRHASYPVIVVSDSDMQVERDFLHRMVSPLKDPGVGLVGALPVYTGGANIWSQALMVYAHLFGLCVAGAVTHLQVPGRFAAGNQAIRRDVLEAVGGFQAIAGYISEDLRLGQLVRRLGLRIVDATITYAPVEPLDADQLTQVLARYQLASRALSLPLYIFTSFLMLAHWIPLLAIPWLWTVTGGISGETVVFGLAPAITRTLVAWHTHIRWAGKVSLAQVAAAATMLDWTFCKALVRTSYNKTVEWRNVKYECLRDGRIRRL